MKQLVILLSAVVLVVGGWLLVSSWTRSAGRFAPLVVPDASAAPATLARSADQLWNAKPRFFQPETVVSFVMLLGERLDDGSLRAVAAPVFFAWREHRTLPAVKAAMPKVNTVLLPRLARWVSLGDLETLVRIAAGKQPDAKQVDAVLSSIAAEPIPAQGFSGSRALDLITASLRVRQFERASSYLEKLSWPASVSSGDRETRLKPIRRLIELCSKDSTGKEEVVEAVALWHAMDSDRHTRRHVREILEDVALTAIKEMEIRQRGREVGALLSASCKRDDARRYWDRVIGRKIGSVPISGTERTAGFGSLLKAFEQRFGETGYECLSWFKVAELAREKKPREPLLRATYLRLALAAAPDDWFKWRAAQAWAAEMRAAGEVAQGLDVVRETAATIEDPELRSALDAVAYHLERDVAADDERVAKEKVVVDQDRLRGQIRHLEEQLSVFRRMKRPADVAALERVIQKLEEKISE